MSHQIFSLQPFPSEESLVDLKIAGNISRHNNQLTINYQVVGELAPVEIPSSVDIPTRKHELWQDTCFEFFIGIKDSQQYWEFNLSPSRNWNIYRFHGYRQGMQEETAFTALPFSIENYSDSLEMSLNVDLERIISPEQLIDVAITTVIKQKDGKITYWALVHPGKEADFHIRDSFIIRL
ncbi:DOMON-like domain-containing protein [Anabaena sp. FACHB-709]|uniref:DOMON-like domain-containing protein n=2 Tax=Nostocaceae TaxID=1162 RepID=A0A1Z4KF81_ANAVA|nr:MULTISPECIES: DOMON-like domain-containing protein [Nostocaceae]BAY67658.1 hypothetical protein NIES23_04360 [Trichormus variabilis NIES-23]HBW33024.1 hypothetical protein [Nostoc sp. UBA8866]MBD2173913.1 DOMON-like domain-containing protein [Anabaena cylindrica FACHB-318]MBD2265662.1 DOMON-like domain-containing protein [Anabaena sp. FACHB-709]MBD2275019.1 DOMON-like domain-containing protein [Nostoc sp. PCC 7120 = FACHB-418]